MESLTYEIKEIEDTQGLRLELRIEDQRVATAGASNEVLDAMEQQLGHDREQVASHLRISLESLLKHQLAKVTLSKLVEVPDRPLRFIARFTYRDHGHSESPDQDRVETGLVWYDVNTSDTGPDDLPAVVRNKMRLEVHRKLTSEGSKARALVELHE